MNKLLSRMTMTVLLAASCFLVAGCGDGEEPAPSETPAARSSETGSSTSGEGSETKESGDGSESK